MAASRTLCSDLTPTSRGPRKIRGLPERLNHLRDFIDGPLGPRPELRTGIRTVSDCMKNIFIN